MQAPVDYTFGTGELFTVLFVMLGPFETDWSFRRRYPEPE
jgi:hypothetical protein